MPAATANPSLNHRTPNGGLSWPGLEYEVHSSQPGPSHPTVGVRLARTLGQHKQSPSMRHFPCRLAVCALWLGISLTAWAQEPLAPTEPPKAQRADLEDQAGVLATDERAQLSELLRTNNENGAGIVQVLILPQLPATESIESVARSQLMNDLNIPGAKQERALLLVSMSDRKLRIATSDALRPSLPDMFCEEVVDNYMLPRFRRGDYFEGIRAGLAAIIGKLQGAKFAVLSNPSLNRSPNGGTPGPVWRYAAHFRQPGPAAPPLVPG